MVEATTKTAIAEAAQRDARRGPRETELSAAPGDFQLLIAAINRGVEREIVDEATRLARIAIAKRRKVRTSHASR